MAWKLVYFTVVAVLVRLTGGLSVPRVPPNLDGERKSINQSLMERYNFPIYPNDPEEFSSWIALGDSYAAGPGAGTPLPHEVYTTCYRTDQAYAPQLESAGTFRTGYGAPHLYFIACTGAITSDVMSQQSPKVTSNDKILTLSIGGNNLGFSSILKSCIYGAFILGRCQTLIANARNTLYSAQFYHDYQSMLSAVTNNANFCPEKEDTQDPNNCRTVLYQTAYPSFFDDFTVLCNSISFSPVGNFAGPNLPQALRSQLNGLGQELNTMLNVFIDSYNGAHAVNGIDAVRFADQGSRYTGHRFCRGTVVEPSKNDPDLWFFHLGDRSGVPGSFEDQSVPGSDYSSIDVSRCEAAADSSKNLGTELTCLIAQLIANGDQPAGGGWPAFEDGAKVKTFHPKAPGFKVTSDEVEHRLNFRHAVPAFYRPGTENSCGSIRGHDLRILAVGDSITWGFRSSDGAGYRRNLYKLLTMPSYADNCPPPNSVVFEGSQFSGPDIEYERSEGYPTLTIAEVRESLFNSGSLQSKPNIILLMAGTNDFTLNNADPLDAAAELDSFIDAILESVDTTILVAHIPLVGLNSISPPLSPINQKIVQFNAAVSARIETRRTKTAGPNQQRVFKVHTSVNPTQAEHADGDDVHPNNYGYDKIADAFYEGLYDADELGWIHPPGQETGLFSTGCPRDPHWIGDGFIASGDNLGRNKYPGITCTASNPEDGNSCACDYHDGNAPVMFPITGNYGCDEMSVPYTTAVRMADIDGDGKADYLWVREDSSVVGFRNIAPHPDGIHDADVSWQGFGQIAKGVGGRRGEIQFAYINGDGYADYLWVHPDGSVDAWLNGRVAYEDYNDHGWIPQGQIAGGIGLTGACVRFADLSGDRRADYLYVAFNGSVIAYVNEPFPANESVVAIVDGVHWVDNGWVAGGVCNEPVGYGCWPRENIYFADTSGNGRADYLVVSHTDGSVLLYYNTGAPLTGDARVHWESHHQIAGGVGSDGTGVVFADLNGDGRVEYLDVHPDDSSVYAWLNGCTT